MATLAPFFAGDTAAGLPVDIRSAGFDVGDGRYDAFSDFEAKLSGKIDFLGQHSVFTLDLRLADEDPGAQRGAAKVTFNENTDPAARYVVHGATLLVDATFAGEAARLAIRAVSGGKATQVAFSGDQNRTVKLVAKTRRRLGRR